MKVNKSHRVFDGELRFCSHHSEQTGTDMDFSVFIPSLRTPPTSAIIWLSGLTCTDKNFMEKSGVQSLLTESNTMIICPDTSPRGLDLPNEHEAYDFGSGAGFYVNAQTKGYKDDYRMYDYINEEIHGLLQTSFDIPNDKISIMGHSMGGHGALILGLKNPQKYQSISAFSPIVNPTQCAWGKKAFTGYLGSDQDLWKGYDACELIKSGASHPNPILVDQGLADDFYPDQLLTENLESVVENSEQKLVLNKREGYDHSYYFIASFLKNHLDFHMAHLST